MAKAPVPQDGNDKAQRRVYVLPNELVERIAAYQQEVGLTSEVEAVRRLLDGALKTRDSAILICHRIYSQSKQGKPLSDAIRDVLWGHPLLEKMEIVGQKSEFFLKDQWSIRFEDDGKATIYRADRPIKYDKRKPEWASEYNEIDDDIPF